MHGPTCSFRANLTPFSLQAAPAAPVRAGTKRVVFQTVCVETGDTVISNAYMDLSDATQPKL
jgi:hypothetical protein